MLTILASELYWLGTYSGSYQEQDISNTLGRIY